MHVQGSAQHAAEGGLLTPYASAAAETEKIMAPDSDVTGLVGSTPAVLLQRVSEGLPGSVSLKLEYQNPGGSVKDRAGLAMIEAAEKDGLIEPHRSVIVEPTSGNTGISLAMVGAARGYRVVLAMPESMSVERRRLLAAYGAELVLTEAGAGMRGAISRASELLEEYDDAFMPQQFENPANPDAHYRTTGPETEASLGGRDLGAFVAGIGTGGTISGAGRYLKERYPDALIVGVEPEDSPVITQSRAGVEPAPAPHVIQGIGAGFVPGNLDVDLLDEVVLMNGEAAIEMGRRLAAEEGLLCGISSGANVVAANEIASRPEMGGKVVATVACSTGERYLSTALWEGLA